VRESAYPRGFETEDDLPEVIVSRVKGSFRGWTGRTRLELLNGQEWEQRSYGYMYRYACTPRVVVMRRHDGHWMRVEGVPGWAPVRRVR
jgi:hypothetical protein